MRQLARRAQGRLIDFIEQRLGWNVVDVHIEEGDDYRTEGRVIRLSVTAEFELDDDNEYRHDPREEVS